MPDMPPPGAQIAGSPKKGNFLIWILVAFGALFLVVCVAVLGTGIFIAHKVRQAGIEYGNDGKFTVKKDGKESVVISSSGHGDSGSVEIKSADGTVKIGGGAAAGKVPTWIPDYPGSDPQGAFTAQTNEGSSGNFSFKTKDPVEKVASFYEDGFKSSGLKVTATVNSAAAAVLSAEDEAKMHSSAVIIGASGGETTVNVTYTSKK
jgi:hypothetical protein